MMKTQNIPFPPNTDRRKRPTRGGFTLVELLVAVSVLIILTVMTLSLVNVSQDEDRVRSGAAQVQSFLEGARDRAIHAGEPRGVRFLLDTENTNLVTSMLYIGAPEVYGEGKSVAVQPVYDTMTGQIVDYEVRPQIDSELAVWRNFHDRGLIVNGSPIQIEGQFYTILRIQSGNKDYFSLTKPFSGSKTTGLRYGLFLNPTVLPNQEPRTLPRNVVIDLDESILPDTWGTTGSYGTLDVLFSPNGTVTGLVASAGVIHMVVADLADVDQNRGVGAPTKEGNERIVSLRTQTGSISVHNVNPTNDPTHPNDAFRYAALGVPAK